MPLTYHNPINVSMYAWGRNENVQGNCEKSNRKWVEWYFNEYIPECDKAKAAAKVDIFQKYEDNFALLDAV